MVLKNPCLFIKAGGTLTNKKQRQEKWNLFISYYGMRGNRWKSTHNLIAS